MNYLIALAAYLIAGGFYAVFRWIILMIEIQILAGSVDKLLPKDQTVSFVEKIFYADLGPEELRLPPDPKQFRNLIGRWILVWPLCIVESIWRTTRGYLNKRG